MTIAFFDAIGHPLEQSEVPFQENENADAADSAEMLRLGRSVRMAGKARETVH